MWIIPIKCETIENGISRGLFDLLRMHVYYIIVMCRISGEAKNFFYCGGKGARVQEMLPKTTAVKMRTQQRLKEVLLQECILNGRS